jgi:hypothetical protein
LSALHPNLAQLYRCKVGRGEANPDLGGDLAAVIDFTNGARNRRSLFDRAERLFGQAEIW